MLIPFRRLKFAVVGGREGGGDHVARELGDAPVFDFAEAPHHAVDQAIITDPHLEYEGR
jgi:hypothetical protein